MVEIPDIVEAVGGDQLARREGLAPFLVAEREKVLQRIDVGRRDVGMGTEILARVEGERGHPPLGPAGLVEVEQRIDACGAHVRIGRLIEGG